jgi:peptidyl-prolyl cis-trans isomerase D
MLDALRRGSTGMVAKILFAVLVVSFAIWGIGPVFRNFGRGSLAKIGDQDIRVEDFQRQLQNEIRIISRQSGRRLSMEEARTAGIDNRVLAQLMAWAAVEQHAAQLDLALSDEALIEQLKKDPAFNGPDEKFSKLTFENVLNQMGLSERGFLKLRRRDELREQLTAALIDSVAVPDEMVDLVNAWREEKRVAQYFAIDAEKVTVPEPDEAKLKATYDANKGQFSTPELRKLALLVVSIDGLKPKMDVSDAEIDASYAETKSDYNTPERRRVQQIAFKDRQAAEAAKKALDSGKKTFGDIAKDVGAKNTDIDLGLVYKNQLIDPKIADAAFSLEKDKISDVVEGRFATVLLRVSAIEPAVTRTLKDVKGEVRDKLAAKKAQAKLQDVIDQVEDSRAAGKPLKEIAEALKLQYIEVPQTDRFNKQPGADTAAIPLPDATSIIKTAFDSDVGLENEPVELRDGGYAWVDVLGITPKKQRPFDEVKADVKKLAIRQEREKLVAELASKLVERADKGESMEALAKEAGAPKLDTTPPFTRTTEPQGLSKGSVQQIFTLTKGRAGSAPTTDGKSRSVFKVTEITPAPEPTKEQRAKIARQLKEQLTDEALSEYVVALQDKLGAHINQEEYRRAIGAETQ